jgi:Fe2+ transport system protein FeoA
VRSIAGERSFRRRLLELGFVPGTEVRMVRRLELGDVLEVQLRESRVSLRISEARVLTISPCESSVSATEAGRREDPEPAEICRP